MSWESLIRIMQEVSASYAGRDVYPQDGRSSEEANHDAGDYFREVTNEFFTEYQKDVVGLLANKEGDYTDLTPEQQVALDYLRDFTFEAAWNRYAVNKPGEREAMEDTIRKIHDQTEQQTFPVGGWGKGPLQQIAGRLESAVVFYVINYNHDRQSLTHYTQNLFQQIRSDYYGHAI